MMASALECTSGTSWSDPEERYHVLSEMVSASAYSFRVKEDGSLVAEWFDPCSCLTGFSPEEAEAQGWIGLVHPQDQAAARAGLQQLLTGQAVDLELRILRRAGEFLWVRVTGRAQRDAATGRIVRLYGAAQDITARKEIEIAHQESQDRYKALSELVSDYAFAARVEPDGRFVVEWITDAFARVTGFSSEEAEQKVMWAGLVHPDDFASTRENMARMLQGKEGEYEFRIVTRSGEIRYLHIFGRPVWDEAEGRVVHLYGAAQDITERKRAEEALRRERDLAERIMNTGPIGIFVTDRKGRVVFVNSYVERALGVALEGLAERRFDSPTWGIASYDGRPVVEAELPFFRVKATGQPANDLHYSIILPDGERYFLSVNAAPLFDAAGQFDGMIAVVIDVSGRVRTEKALRQARDELEARVVERTAELERANQDLQAEIGERKRAEEAEREQRRLVEQSQLRLIQSEKLAATGRLAASLAHEINNPLQSLYNCFQLMARFSLNEEEQQEYLQIAGEEVERLVGITNSILDFARHSQRETQPTDLNEVIERVLSLVNKYLQNQSIALRRNLAPDLPPLLAGSELAQVFLNIVLNAVDAMPDGGTLSISSQSHPGRLAVTLADTGCGIPAEHLDRIFEPFFSTKEGSTGLGLTICYSVVQQHGGEISVESEVGRGTTFTVWLPALPEQYRVRAKASSLPTERKGGGQ